ncbi:MAG: tRNA (adenosine(37)-N6)-threonylcarbamoyltransferase complex ATPase subunit type 1 TsaE [Polynucleobacter sp.]|nr:tRNA (adenosine(37)-N6)-threonylcarbamoyltransferase complex ATPase subunit type 1 TsaE [Polynucleobacter sp.]
MELYCRSEAETSALAHKMASALLRLQPSMAPKTYHLTIALQGDLGSGKTTFTRALLGHLGHQGKVKSPTYTLCESYEVDKPVIAIHHFDLYRMRSAREWEEAGFAEYFLGDENRCSICLVEWPEKAEGTLPTFDVQIQIDYADENQRMFDLRAASDLGKQIIAALS